MEYLRNYWVLVDHMHLSLSMVILINFFFHLQKQLRNLSTKIMIKNKKQYAPGNSEVKQIKSRTRIFFFESKESFNVEAVVESKFS